MKNKEMFKKFMAGLAELFDKNLSNALSDIYWASLKEFSDEQCKDAFNKAITTLKWFPKPVELIELIIGGKSDLESIAHQQADLVIDTIRKKGAYRSVRFVDEVTNTVIQNTFGAWIKMCSESLELNEKWIRKDFMDAYRRYATLGVRSDQHMAGLIETDNETKGFIDNIPEVEFIGGDESEHLRRLN